MAGARRITALLTFEELEPRIVPSGTYPWPVPINANDPLISTYGQYYGAPVMKLHEGIDIFAPKDTPVTAIQAGVVVGISAPATTGPMEFVVFQAKWHKG